VAYAPSSAFSIARLAAAREDVLLVGLDLIYGN
jgi:hypothetical protein